MNFIRSLFSRGQQSRDHDLAPTPPEGSEYQPFYTEKNLLRIFMQEGNPVVNEEDIYDGLCLEVRHYGWRCGEIVVDEQVGRDEFLRSLADIGYGFDQPIQEPGPPFVAFIRWMIPTRGVDSDLIDSFRHEVQIGGLRAVMLVGEDFDDIHPDIIRNATARFI